MLQSREKKDKKRLKYINPLNNEAPNNTQIELQGTPVLFVMVSHGNI